MEDFVSPLFCEQLIDAINFTVPDTDKDGKELLTIRTNETAEAVIYERLLNNVLPKIQPYYNFTYKGTEPVSFEWFPEGSKGEFICENSNYLRRKWLRVRQRDFTGILFMCDYQEKVPFETDFEVYGGKLEFIQHQFGFQPIRGTLVIFPSVPHFINITTQILAGDLFQARIQIAATIPYLYTPVVFPGDYRTWFNQVDLSKKYS